MYETYYFGGMHFIWWLAWIVLLMWIFALPYNIPGQRMKKDSALDILKKRFANGEIDFEEYNGKKRVIENDSLKKK